MESKKTKPKHAALWAMSLAVVALVLGFCMLLTDDFKGSENIANAEGLGVKVAKSVVLNKDIVLSKDELNNFILSYIAKNEYVPEKLKTVTFIPSSKEDIMYIYFPVNFLGKNFRINAQTRVNLVDEKLEIEVQSAHVGKIRIPKKFVINHIKKQFGEVLTFEGAKFYLDPNIKIDILGVGINIGFEKFKIENECVVFKLKTKGNLRLPDINGLI